MKNTCIVLEGGGLRGAFTCGVLEYLLENDFNFGRVIGVSAGACNAASYVSKQIGRNWKVNIEFPSDKRFMGLSHLITKGSYFNMPFIFGEIPDKLVPFDDQAVFDNPVEFEIVVTSFESGKSVVMTKNDIAQFGMDKVLMASSSIPFLSQPVSINGHLYYDGGVSDSIPVKYALRKHDKAVVVFTRPRGYRKGKTSHRSFIKFVFRKHPEFAEAMLSRNDAYNKTLDFCEQMEKEGKLYLIAPSAEFSIGRTEQNLEKRAALYHHGYELISKEFEKMKAFLQ
jgi:predicted patatin/cPLA2 family phospholipase